MHRSRRRVAAITGALACWALVVVHALAAFDLVFRQRVGPVIAVVDAGAGMGVHSGDMLVIPIMLSALACIVAGVACVGTFLRAPQRLPWRDAIA